jgi:hypothetical protein
MKSHPSDLKLLYKFAHFSSLLKILVLGMYVKLQKTEIILIMTLFYGVLDNKFPHPLTLEGNQHFPYSCHSCALEENEPT